jgi:hypothetical protein
MPSLEKARIRQQFDHAPNGDLQFTMTVIARKGGVEVQLGTGKDKEAGLISHHGSREQGWASAAEHFGRYLSTLCQDDLNARHRAEIHGD